MHFGIKGFMVAGCSLPLAPPVENENRTGNIAIINTKVIAFTLKLFGLDFWSTGYITWGNSQGRIFLTDNSKGSFPEEEKMIFKSFNPFTEKAMKAELMIIPIGPAL